MKLKQIDAFVKVAETGSFSKTAKELYLTQPTVSAHIAALEKEMGVKLFARTTKKVILTESGKKLYYYAKQMLELSKTMEHLFQKEACEEKRKIRIAASTIPAQYLLPQIIAEYTRQYPKIKFEIQEMDSAKVVAGIVDQAYDIGFTGTVLEKEFCRYIPFYWDQLVLIMPATEAYRQIKEQEKDINWILKQPVIMREEGSGTRREAQKQLAKAGIDLEQLNIVANIESPEAIKRSVKRGLGISIISKLAVKEELEEGSILEFPLSDHGSRRTLNLVYHNSYPLSKSAEQLIQVVKELYLKKWNGA